MTRLLVAALLGIGLSVVCHAMLVRWGIIDYLRVRFLDETGDML